MMEKRMLAVVRFDVEMDVKRFLIGPWKKQMSNNNYVDSE